MAQVKNFGLIGVGTDLQFGKAGTRLINDTGTMRFKQSDGTTDAPMTAFSGEYQGSETFSGVTLHGTVTNPTDATTKEYVDNAIAGLTWKAAVNLFAADNVDLTGTSLTIDGNTVDNGYRVLLTAQTTDSENGIYVATVGTGTYTLDRAADADTYQELIGASVFVLEGDQYAGTAWVQTNHYLTSFAGQTWVQFAGGGAYTAGDGITIVATNISANADEVTITANGGTGGQLSVLSSATVGQTLLSNGSGDASWGALDLSNANAITGVFSPTQVIFVADDGSLTGDNAVEIADYGIGYQITTSNDALIHGATFGLGNYAGNASLAAGYQALANDQSARNTAVGGYAGQSNVGGTDNAWVGSFAGQFNTYGYSNSAFGSYALRNNTTGHNNTAIGVFSQQYAYGSYNTSVGKDSLPNATENFNSAFGTSTLNALTTGTYNVAVGAWALGSMTSGIFNTAIGPNAMYQGYGNYNIAIGNYAGNSLNGDGNVVIGALAGDAGTNETIYLGTGTGTERLRINDSAAWSFGDQNYGGVGELFISQGDTAAAQWSGSGLTFDIGTDTLSVGGGGGLDINGDTATISATGANTDLTLLPNTGGSVIIGSTGASTIASGTGESLTVTGTTTLTLNSTTGALTIGLPAGTSSANKVEISGPSAADYATNLNDTSLVNKYYVDQAIATGAAAGSIKAVQASVDLGTDGATNIGAILPAGATIIRVKVKVVSADATATLAVGRTGLPAGYMTTSENDPQITGLYVSEDYITESTATQVTATVSGATGGSPAASALVIVEYQVAEV